MPAAGVIVFDTANPPASSLRTIIVCQDGTNYGFPKGGQEEGENLEQTAKRELKEETGLTDDDVIYMDGGFIYEVKPNGNRGVCYLVAALKPGSAYCLGKSFTFDPDEIDEVQLTETSDAKRLLGGKRRDVLMKAIDILERKWSSSSASSDAAAPAHLASSSSKVLAVDDDGAEKKIPSRVMTTGDDISGLDSSRLSKQRPPPRRGCGGYTVRLSDRISSSALARNAVTIAPATTISVPRGRGRGRGGSSSIGCGRGSGSSNRGIDNKGRMFWLSKTLAWLLRHKLSDSELDLQPNDEGYVSIARLKKNFPRLQNATLEEFKFVVDNDTKYGKDRFKIIESSDGELLIRANQGHSLSVGEATKEEEEKKKLPSHSIKLDDEKMMTRIIKPLPICVHGTNVKSLALILGLDVDTSSSTSVDDSSSEEKKKIGLCRMLRKHIHFATGFDKKSGMRGGCPVKIYIDMDRAMADGIEFFMSSNGVILSAGKDGWIHPRYFAHIDDETESPKVESMMSKLSSLQV